MLISPAYAQAAAPAGGAGFDIVSFYGCGFQDAVGKRRRVSFCLGGNNTDHQ